jgi:DNA-binding SARP family transcriptional activator
MFDCRVLGRLEVRVDGRPVDVGPAKRQCVLAVLLVEANRAVSVDQIVDRVWADQPPPRVRSSLHSYLTGLRRVLRPAAVSITGRSGVYVLSVDEKTVDLHRFRHLVARARATRDDAQGAVLLQQALRLWRGEAFAGLDTPWLQRVRDTLERERFEAELDHTDLELRGGRHTALVSALSTRVEQHPLDERLVGQLMLALYRSGRQADALRVFQHTRTTMCADLGIEPCTDLQRLHQRILRADPGIAAPSARNGSGVLTVAAARVCATGAEP